MKEALLQDEKKELSRQETQTSSQSAAEKTCAVTSVAAVQLAVLPLPRHGKRTSTAPAYAFDSEIFNVCVLFNLAPNQLYSDSN